MLESLLAHSHEVTDAATGAQMARRALKTFERLLTAHPDWDEEQVWIETARLYCWLGDGERESGSRRDSCKLIWKGSVACTGSWSSPKATGWPDTSLRPRPRQVRLCASRTSRKACCTWRRTSLDWSRKKWVDRTMPGGASSGRSQP